MPRCWDIQIEEEGKKKHLIMVCLKWFKIQVLTVVTWEPTSPTWSLLVYKTLKDNYWKISHKFLKTKILKNCFFGKTFSTDYIIPKLWCSQTGPPAKIFKVSLLFNCKMPISTASKLGSKPIIYDKKEKGKTVTCRLEPYNYEYLANWSLSAYL